MRVEDHVRIASITKTFTAETVLLLADEGRLGLDDPLSRYIPGVRDGDVITIRQLNHSGNMISTAGDLAVWGRAFAEGSLLSPRMRVRQRSFVRVQSGEDAFEGLGMDKWGDLIGHSGMDPGYSSDMRYIPYADALVVVVSNLWSGPVPGREILMDVARALHPEGVPAGQLP